MHGIRQGGAAQLAGVAPDVRYLWHPAACRNINRVPTIGGTLPASWAREGALPKLQLLCAEGWRWGEVAGACARAL